eukprot:6174023-Pleurochrysis_carterae.AAC.13
MPFNGTSWAERTNVWARLPKFPSAAARARAIKHGTTPMATAYRVDFSTFSTNLIGIVNPRRKPATAPPYPSLVC